jgi:A/G-specific adenine glycosylase
MASSIYATACKMRAGGASAAEVARTRRRIIAWGKENFRPYPWRFEDDPWLSFVAEFLLQRTRASQVASVFSEFRQRYPTPSDLVKAGPSATTLLTRRLGLHWRGPLLLRAAEAFLQSGGCPPETLEALQELPGVGRYTAAAWLSLHRGKRAAIVDANVARWLSRMTGRPYNRDPRRLPWLHDLAETLTPRRAFRAYNYAVLDFTMRICTPRKPLCHLCPVRKECLLGCERMVQDRVGKSRFLEQSHLG